MTTRPTAPEHNPAVLAARFARALLAEAAAVTLSDVRARSSVPGPVSVAVVAVRLDELAARRPAPRAAPAWRQAASCAGVDPELFYPRRGGSKVRQGEQIAAAKAVCGGCPVRAQCLSDALEHQEEHGIWGGLSERERRRLQRALPRVARCARCAGRYVKRAPGQKFCGVGCPGLARPRARQRAS